MRVCERRCGRGRIRRGSTFEKRDLNEVYGLVKSMGFAAVLKKKSNLPCVPFTVQILSNLTKVLSSDNPFGAELTTWAVDVLLKKSPMPVT